MEVALTVRMHWGTVVQACARVRFCWGMCFFSPLSFPLKLLTARGSRTFARIGENPLRGFQRHRHLMLSSLSGNVTSTSTCVCRNRLWVSLCVCVVCVSCVCVCASPFPFSWKDDFCCLAAVTVRDGAAEKEDEERPQIKHGSVICKGDPLTLH